MTPTIPGDSPIDFDVIEPVADEDLPNLSCGRMLVSDEQLAISVID